MTFPHRMRYYYSVTSNLTGLSHACETGSIVGNGGHSTGVNSHTLLPQFGRDMGQVGTARGTECLQWGHLSSKCALSREVNQILGPKNAWAETGRYWSQGAMEYGSHGTSRPPKGRIGSRQFSREGI
ncbi:hypothetical protein CDAR_198551 [Caerostris darwini]|uniref:Uncharacterized protein n=1 Tax=Caerostris darwini TaxID=1538125 RepID=A0AAV4W3G3_9ARAC|nr:hypothetical protein CDAR_198551 [Caerostris darwini]